MMNKFRSLFKYFNFKHNQRKKKLLEFKFFTNFAYLFLIKGKYKFDLNRKIIYKNGFRKQYLLVRKNVFLNISKKVESKLILRLIDSFFNRPHKFYVQGKTPLFFGELAILGSANQDIKFFDFKKKEVLSVYENKERALSNIKKRKKLKSEGFNILNFSIKQLSGKIGICEPLVSIQDYNHDNVLHYIIRLYTSLHQNRRPTNLLNSKIHLENIARFTSLNNKNIKNSTFFKSISKNTHCSRFCHGDFHYLNFLFDGNEYFFIDYEFANYHIFFYDIFFYIFFELFRVNNFALWENLENGLYDIELADLFRANGIKYKRGDLIFYLMYVVFDFYSDNPPKDALALLKTLMTNYE